MPIAPPVLHPPFNIVRALYADLGSTDLARARSFWVDALGYVVSEDTGDALYLRGLEEQNHHSLILRAATAPVVNAIGFRVLEEADLDRAAEFCAARGLAHRYVDRHAQGRTLEMIDPARHSPRADGVRDARAAPAAALRRTPRRAAAADRSRQLLLARCAGRVRLLSRHSASASANTPRPTTRAICGRCGCIARATFTTWR